MTNLEINTKYLAAITAEKKAEILGNIAKHYGCDVPTIEENVLDEDAEHLAEYVTVNRNEVYADMVQHGCGFAK